MSEQDLKPCPFCGGNELEIVVTTQHREGCSMSVVCSGCGATGPFIYCLDGEDYKAKIAWNMQACTQKDISAERNDDKLANLKLKAQALANMEAEKASQQAGTWQAAHEYHCARYSAMVDLIRYLFGETIISPTASTASPPD